MRTLNTILTIAGAALLLFPATALADTPGHHPHYLHARGDLQEARALLRGPMDPNIQSNFQSADSEIQGAIRELNRAAWADAKDVRSASHPDAHPDPVGRFRNLMKLLERARKDLAVEEDNPAAMGWRDGAFHHIDAAISYVRQGASAAHYDRQLGW